MGRSRSRSRSPRRDRERMGRRSRSRSRERERRRGVERGERHRERERDRERPAITRDRRRSRSPSPSRWPRGRSPPGRRRSLSPLPSSSAKHSKNIPVERPEIDESQLKGKTDEEIEMMKAMGFCNFDTTKNKQVNKGDIYVAHIMRKRRYRQYMNRRGGFNRPLDFIA